jgi:hypothetical protein
VKKDPEVAEEAEEAEVVEEVEEEAGNRFVKCIK